MSARSVLEVEDLEVHYGLGRRRRRVLDGVSLSVSNGEAVGLICVDWPPAHRKKRSSQGSAP